MPQPSGSIWEILKAVGDQAMGRIVGRDTYLYPVSNHDLNAVFLHPSGEHTPYGDVVITLNFHGATT